MSIVNTTTPIQNIDNNYLNNELYIKRDDLIPYSFGGNKARKAVLFFEAIDKGNYDTVVTYGSNTSNHCRIISNLAVSKGMDCYIVSPEDFYEQSFNRQLINLFGATVIKVKVSEVHENIEELIDNLYLKGKKPFFIQGGGHGDIGTLAYVNCYNEIKKYEEEKGIFFDYIFHASGTGTTQAGLVCGQLINKDSRKVIGISIARKNPYGRTVVLDSVKSYLNNNNLCISSDSIDINTHFVDDYINDGYGKYNESIKNTINEIMTSYGLPLDPTYTGKAFYGMKEYIKSKNIKNKKLLFIHTGGTPLFFDFLRRQANAK